MKNTPHTNLCDHRIFTLHRLTLLFFCALFLCCAIPHADLAAQSVSLSSPEILLSTDTTMDLAYNNTAYLASNPNGDTYYAVYSTTDSIFFLTRKNGQPVTKRTAHTGSKIGLTALATGSNSFLWIVWSEEVGGRQVIRAKYSQNEGQLWKGPYALSTTGKGSSPSISAGGNGFMHVVWFSDSAGVSHIQYNRYDPATDSFLPNPLRIDEQPNSNASWASITAHKDTLFAAWKDKQSGSFQIYLRISTNNGEHWIGSQKISTEGNCGDPTVAFVRTTPTSSIISVAYQHSNKNIGVKRSTNFGQSWLSTQPISTHGLFARILADESGFVAVNFEYYKNVNASNKDDKNKDVGFAYSTDFGDTFSSDSVGWYHSPVGTSTPTIHRVHEKLYLIAWKQINAASHELLLRQVQISTMTGIPPSSVSSPQSVQLVASPNPFRQTITITLNLGETALLPSPQAQEQNARFLRVVDLLGREVYRSASISDDVAQCTISFTPQTNHAGMYLVQLVTKTGILLQKMILRQ